VDAGFRRQPSWEFSVSPNFIELAFHSLLVRGPWSMGSGPSESIAGADSSPGFDGMESGKRVILSLHGRPVRFRRGYF